MGWFKDFTTSFAATTAAGLTQGLADSAKAQESGLGTMLSEGTQSDFDKYVAARQAAVKGEYDKYTTKFDAFEQQAKEFASLVGSPSAQNLSTELDGMEAAARFMQGKSQAEIQDTISKLKAIRDEGGNVRERVSDLIKRGKDQEVRNYTAQDVARMQLGGAFSYTAKPYDLSKRRTGLARFLRDDLGLYGETFAKEREALAERQARDVTASLPGYDKYAGTGDSRYDRPQAGLSFAGLDLRTEAQKRSERMDIAKEKLTGVELKRAEQSYLFAQNAERDRVDLFAITKKNSMLEQQYKMGQLDQQKYEKQVRETQDAITGKPEKDALAVALRADKANPTVETAAAVRQAQQAVQDHASSLGFYSAVQKEVERIKGLDKRFESKKQAGTITADIGAKDIAGFKNSEEALKEESRIWQQTFIKAYRTLSPVAKERVNLTQFGMNIDETFTNAVKEFYMLKDVGNKATGEGSSDLDKLEAGIMSAYPNMSAKDRQTKLENAIKFAYEHKIAITGNAESTNKQKSSGLGDIPEDTGDYYPGKGNQVTKKPAQAKPDPKIKALKDIEERISILKKQIDRLPKWMNRRQQKQEELWQLESQRLDIKNDKQ